MSGDYPKGNCFAPKILAIAEKHGAYNVRVFGSAARGEAPENSDIDSLVDYELERITP